MDTEKWVPATEVIEYLIHGWKKDKNKDRRNDGCVCMVDPDNVGPMKTVKGKGTKKKPNTGKHKVTFHKQA